MRKTTAHFWNLNEDPQLSNMVHHFVTSGRPVRYYQRERTRKVRVISLIMVVMIMLIKMMTTKKKMMMMVVVITK